MSSEQAFVDYVIEQSGLGEQLSFRKMFGEYALYLHEKVVALVCDNQLFIKPTQAGRDLLGDVSEQPPYPGAKPSFLIADTLDDSDLLRRVFIATAEELPIPKPKRAKKPRNTPTKRK